VGSQHLSSEFTLMGNDKRGREWMKLYKWMWRQAKVKRFSSRLQQGGWRSHWDHGVQCPSLLCSPYGFPASSGQVPPKRPWLPPSRPSPSALPGEHSADGQTRPPQIVPAGETQMDRDLQRSGPCFGRRRSINRKTEDSFQAQGWSGNVGGYRGRCEM
jgi:hypothetical protein